jgi:ABC-2 type transport system permease protein
MSAPSAASPVASGEPRRRPAALNGGPLRRLLAGTAAMSLTEWRKLRHDQLDLITRSVQPLLWLFVFGTAMSRLKAIPTGGHEYRAYLAPGVMAQAAMFVAIFFGLAVIWERDVGQLQRLLATPLPRSALVLGKAAGAATRAVIQASLLLIVIAIAGISLDWSVTGVLFALVLLAIGTGAFACLSMSIASLVKERERFMGIGQLVMMPLFFASSALYPLAIMPGWLKGIAHVNPLTYEVEGLRGFLLGGGHPWVDLLVCTGWLVVLAAAATRAYPKAIL